jgi:acyl-CoA thioester hydrolase
MDLHRQLIRVYFEDTDAGGIVYHASWLRFFERARTDWLRGFGISQGELARTGGPGFVVRSLQIDYLHPARLDDLIEVELELSELRRASILLRQTARLDGEPDCLVEARVRIAAIDPGTGRATALPWQLTDQLKSASSAFQGA